MPAPSQAASCRAGDLEHLVADRHDEVTVLGHIEEVARVHESHAGPIPSQQPLEPAHGTATGLDDRLILEQELAVVDRAAQRLLGGEPVRDRRAQLLVEHLEAIAAPRLGAVGGRVGLGQQHVAVGRVVGDRDANARAEEEVGVADAERPLDDGSHALGERRDRGRIGEICAEHHELVATEPAGEIRPPEHRLQPHRGGGEQLVAGRVAERVVDLLEVVEVDEQHRERGVAPARREQLPFERLEEQLARRQTGEHVIARLALERVGVRLVLGDVGDLPDLVERFTIGRAHDADVDPAPDVGAAAVPVALLDHVVMAVPGGALVVEGHVGGQVVGVCELGESAPHHLLGRVAEHGAQGRVHSEETPGQLSERHADRRVLEDLFESHARVVQRGVGLALFGLARVQLGGELFVVGDVGAVHRDAAHIGVVDQVVECADDAAHLSRRMERAVREGDGHTGPAERVEERPSRQLDVVGMHRVEAALGVPVVGGLPTQVLDRGRAQVLDPARGGEQAHEVR